MKENHETTAAIHIAVTKPSKDYELIDSGENEKLERFGAVVLRRPDPQALWPKRLSVADWKKVDGSFVREDRDGKWEMKKGDTETPTATRWPIDFGGLKFWIKPTAFKHTGLFPEQSTNWDWLRNVIGDKKDVEVLNLFGYTGGASLACAQAGAKVVHVDGSKSAITWARENAELSGLADKPIRWILEDARLFVEREIKRGRQYSGIIMDPPAFGHGADKEVWKIEEDFLALMADCMQLLREKPLFMLVNGYSSGYSAVAYKNNLLPLMALHGGEVEMGELLIEESLPAPSSLSHVPDMPKRLLPAGIFARWKK